jgi:hypothetical protein
MNLVWWNRLQGQASSKLLNDLNLGVSMSDMRGERLAGGALAGRADGDRRFPLQAPDGRPGRRQCAAAPQELHLPAGDQIKQDGYGPCSAAVRTVVRLGSRSVGLAQPGFLTTGFSRAVPRSGRRLGSRISLIWARAMVPRKGLEPSRPLSHWHLKPARLPIPPPGPGRVSKDRSHACQIASMATKYAVQRSRVGVSRIR